MSAAFTFIADAFAARPWSIIIAGLLIVVFLSQLLLPRIIPSLRSSGKPRKRRTSRQQEKLLELFGKAEEVIDISYDTIFRTVSYDSPEKQEIARKLAARSHDKLELIVRNIRGYADDMLEVSILIWWTKGIGLLLGQLSNGELGFHDEVKRELKGYREKLNEWTHLYDEDSGS